MTIAQTATTPLFEEPRLLTTAMSLIEDCNAELRLTRAVRELGTAHQLAVEWEIKKLETVMPWEA